MPSFPSWPPAVYHLLHTHTHTAFQYIDLIVKKLYTVVKSSPESRQLIIIMILDLIAPGVRNSRLSRPERPMWSSRRRPPPRHTTCAEIAYTRSSSSNWHTMHKNDFRRPFQTTRRDDHRGTSSGLHVTRGRFLSLIYLHCYVLRCATNNRQVANVNIHARSPYYDERRVERRCDELPVRHLSTLWHDTGKLCVAEEIYYYVQFCKGRRTRPIYTWLRDKRLVASELDVSGDYQEREHEWRGLSSPSIFHNYLLTKSLFNLLMDFWISIPSSTNTWRISSVRYIREHVDKKMLTFRYSYRNLYIYICIYIWFITVQATVYRTVQIQHVILTSTIYGKRCMVSHDTGRNSLAEQPVRHSEIS